MGRHLARQSRRGRIGRSGIALLAAALVTFAVPGAAHADTTIDTIGSWDGFDYGFPFGVPDTATYGQVITVPAGETSLSSFTFEMEQPSTLVFRGEVYAWDAGNGRATGSNLWEGGPRTTTQGAAFEQVTFHTGGIAVTAGSQYVIFASVSKDDGQSDATGNWGAVGYGNAYSGGNFVYLNNGSDESQWTSAHWTDYGQDTAFRAVFGTAQVTGLAPTITGLAQVGQTLTANAGPVDPADSTLSYQWKADGANISGATGPTLLLTPDLAGARIKVRITASHDGYTSETETSPATAYVRELVKHPQAVLDTTALCTAGTVDVLGQGLTPGNSYTITGVGPTVTRTADVYGEVHATLQVPPSWTNGPHEDHSVAISGTHPKVNVAAVFVLNCR